jgi:hypothetical protein
VTPEIVAYQDKKIEGTYFDLTIDYRADYVPAATRDFNKYCI